MKKYKVIFVSFCILILLVSGIVIFLINNKKNSEIIDGKDDKQPTLTATPTLVQIEKPSKGKIFGYTGTGTLLHLYNIDTDEDTTTNLAINDKTILLSISENGENLIYRDENHQNYLYDVSSGEKLSLGKDFYKVQEFSNEILSYFQAIEYDICENPVPDCISYSNALEYFRIDLTTMEKESLGIGRYKDIAGDNYDSSSGNVVGNYPYMAVGNAIYNFETQKKNTFNENKTIYTGLFTGRGYVYITMDYSDTIDSLVMNLKIVNLESFTSKVINKNASLFSPTYNKELDVIIEYSELDNKVYQYSFDGSKKELLNLTKSYQNFAMNSDSSIVSFDLNNKIEVFDLVNKKSIDFCDKIDCTSSIIIWN